MSKKFFKKFAAEDLFTRYIFELMQERKTFMVFTYKNQILIDDEVDERLELLGYNVRFDERPKRPKK